MVALPGYRPVVCAIVERGTMVLAARRKAEQTNGGLWEFPGGKVREGESLGAALSREIHEELGVTVTVHHGLPPVVWEYPWISIELFPFVCSVAGNVNPQPLDHAELRFVGGTEMLKLQWAPADRVIVERYYGGTESGGG